MTYVTDATVFFFDRIPLTINNEYTGLELMISCAFDPLKQPVRVSVDSQHVCKAHSIAVTHVQPAKPQFDVGVCVPVLYGDISKVQAIRLVEWVEVHRMFGVSEFNMYNVSLQRAPETFLSILRYYTSQNIIRWKNVQSPFDIKLDTYYYRIR